MDLKEIQILHETFPSLIPLIGKAPFEKNWQQSCEKPRPFNPEEFKKYNAGIPGGPANGVIILDIDHVAKFNKLLKAKGWKLPETRVHLTGSGKPHYLYAYPKNSYVYGCRSFNDPDGEKDPSTGKVIKVFDVKGLGGQVVAPGSTHPDTGRKYTVHNDVPFAPAPEWLLDLCRQSSDSQAEQPPGGEAPSATAELDSLQLSYAIKKLIRDGETKGRRSEALMSVLNALVRAHLDDQSIIAIFEAHPQGIGQKYMEAGNTRQKWLLEQVKKVRSTESQAPQGSSKRDIAAIVKTYLLDEFDGGTFKLSDLRKELGLNDYEYTLARNCVKRMVEAERLQKHGHTLGGYRVVDTRKREIDWTATEAAASNLLLPGKIHEIATVRDGDLICIAAFKNQAKTAMAIETVRINVDSFQVHFFITEYAARMKSRLLSFGIDLKHPHLHCYPMEKFDYIPDKIEPGKGVLNLIDHYPNVDNFYLVGKTQDEICNRLNGAICVLTHQKLKPADVDAVGGSFWLGAPTLAVTLFHDEQEEYRNRMLLRKAKEPRTDREANGLSMRFKLTGGCRFTYDPRGWL